MRVVKRVLPALVLVLILVAAQPAPVHSQLQCFPPAGWCYSVCGNYNGGFVCLDVSYYEYFCGPVSWGCVGFQCWKCDWWL